MNAIFAPAILLMAQLRFTYKFAVLGFVALLAVGTQQFLLQKYYGGVIEPSRQELRGLRMVSQLAELTKNLQQHRGLSSGLLNGKTAMREPLLAKQKAIETLLAETNTMLDPTLQENPYWQRVNHDWAGIQKEGLQWSAASSFTRHTQMIKVLHDFTVSVADNSALTLDPDIDTYYLMLNIVQDMPQLLETLGQARAKGTAFLAAGAVPGDQRYFLPLLGSQLDIFLSNVTNNSQKIASHSQGSTDFDEALKKFSSATQGASEDIKLGNIFEMAIKDPQDYFNEMTAIIDAGNDLMMKQMASTMEKLVQQRIDRQSHELLISQLLAVGVIALFIYFAIAAYINMTVEIKEISQAADKLADGDFSVRTHLRSNDELAEVGLAFNRMGESVGNLVANVTRNSSRVAEAAQSLAAASNQISLSTEQQSAAATEIAAAVEQFTVSIDHIASNAGVAREVSAQSGNIAEQGGHHVVETVLEMGRVAEVVREASAVVEELGTKSLQISEIVTTINAIADQTNLLALNAAIEAARAGDSGRGFAVVADEVRQLARRTAECTQQITEMVTTIRGGTEKAVLSMRNGVETVANGVELSKRAGASMADISSETNEVMRVVGEISLALQEQSLAAGEVAGGVENIAQMAVENFNATRANADTALHLQKLANELRGELQRFRV